MTRLLRHSLAASAATLLLAACGGGSKSDVRQTAFESSGVSGVTAGLDSTATWSCGDADMQAVFSPSFTGDALIAAVKTAIADPKKADAAFSFVDPIDSFSTDFEARALCMRLRVSSTAEETDALVKQLRRTGNVLTVRMR